MASLTASGLGSGLDVNSIVTQLMSLERRPLDNLNAFGKKLDSQLSAYGQLKSALATFQTAMKGLSSADKFQIFSAISSDETLFTATADKNASVANHTIEVISLAQTHKLTSGKLGAPSYANGSTSIGAAGTLEITQDISGTPRTFQITIDGTNDTLSGIRDAINNAAGNSGVTASVVNTGTESKLVLRAKDSGLSNAITIGAGTTASVATALGFETLAGNSAADASVKIDGVTIASSTNVITSALQGVSLTLKKSGASQSLDITRDTAAVKSSVQKFVDAYNDVRKVIKTLGANDASLEGESVLKNIDRKIQSVFNTSVTGLSYNHLTEIGIKTDPKTGDISLDSTKLDSALAANYSAVADLFAHGTEGFAVRFAAVASDMTSASGLIESRKEGINSRISDIGKRRSSFEYRLERAEIKYRAQFTALDGLISKLQSTGNFLAQQLSRLPG